MGLIPYICELLSAGMDNTAHPIHIILVDDDPDDRFFFREIVSEIKTPLELKEFEDGEAFLNYLKECSSIPPPHLVLLDINMPKKNGIECLQELRADHRFNDLPVVMFTTSTNIRDIEDSYNHGANNFVKKAYTFEEGKNAFESLLKKLENDGFKEGGRDSFFMG